MLNIDIESLLTIYNISSIFAEFSRCNLRSILCEILRRTIKYNINRFDMRQLIELSKFHCISYKDVNVENIIYGEISFDLHINIQYSYNDFIISGCEMESTDGVTPIIYYRDEIRKPLSHKMDDEYETYYYIKASFDLFHTDFINTMNGIYKSYTNVIYANKRKMKMWHLNIDMPEPTGIRRPIYYERDLITNEIIPKTNPMMYLKLSPKFHQNIIFNGNHINIAELYDKNIKFIPLIHLRALYCKDQQCMLKHEIIGAEILSMI